MEPVLNKTGFSDFFLVFFEQLHLVEDHLHKLYKHLRRVRCELGFGRTDENKDTRDHYLRVHFHAFMYGVIDLHNSLAHLLCSYFCEPRASPVPSKEIIQLWGSLRGDSAGKIPLPGDAPPDVAQAISFKGETEEFSRFFFILLDAIVATEKDTGLWILRETNRVNLGDIQELTIRASEYRDERRPFLIPSYEDNRWDHDKANWWAPTYHEVDPKEIFRRLESFYYDQLLEFSHFYQFIGAQEFLDMEALVVEGDIVYIGAVSLRVCLERNDWNDIRGGAQAFCIKIRDLLINRIYKFAGEILQITSAGGTLLALRKWTKMALLGDTGEIPLGDSGLFVRRVVKFRGDDAQTTIPLSALGIHQWLDVCEFHNSWLNATIKCDQANQKQLRALFEDCEKAITRK